LTCILDEKRAGLSPKDRKTRVLGVSVGDLAKLVALTLPQFAAAIALFLPGFVSLKVDRLIQPGKSASASELAVDALAYSLLNAALLGWAIWLAAANLNSSSPNYALLWGYGVLVCVVGPTLWPFLFRAVQRFGARRRWLLGPHRFAWDNFFTRNEACWVVIHLKSGALVGGYFGVRSYATVEPESGQLYLEELWQLDQSGKFVGPVVDSKGGIFRPADYDWIEMFDDGPSRFHEESQ
jgi:hypothetical protein